MKSHSFYLKNIMTKIQDAFSTFSKKSLYLDNKMTESKILLQKMIRYPGLEGTDKNQVD